MEARFTNVLFNLFLILTIIIIALLTTICSQIPVEISNSNIDFFSMLLPILAPLKEEIVRDKLGRFTSLKDSKNVNPLPKDILNPLVGSMLGDGSIRFGHKDKMGKPSGNAKYAMTLKSHEYIMHLWSNIYSQLCTATLPRP
jgi:hypothetical protein